MKDRTVLLIIAIICITVLESLNLVFNRVDGTILSIIVGAIVFVATGKYYGFGKGVSNA